MIWVGLEYALKDRVSFIDQDIFTSRNGKVGSILFVQLFSIGSSFSHGCHISIVNFSKIPSFISLIVSWKSLFFILAK